MIEMIYEGESSWFGVSKGVMSTKNSLKTLLGTNPDSENVKKKT